jgi:catechol 2,3-dioxygenase-like lactoylglutathione lyase family enzyme
MNRATALPNLPNGATIRQICLVVRDLDRAMATWTALGIGPWRVHDLGPNWISDMTFRGNPQLTACRFASADSGDLNFELIEPGEEPNVYTEHLETHGEGLHHLGYFVADIQGAIDAMEALGYQVVQSGRRLGVDGDGAYAYFDTVERLGCMLEAIQPPRQLPEPIRWYPAPPDEG